MCDQKLASSLANIYDGVLLHNPLSISLWQLQHNIRVCQKECGYYLPIDILQCFTTGCKPSANARTAPISDEQCEHKLLLHVGYLLTRFANEHCTDWRTQGALFMEKGRVDEHVLELLAADFPPWFRRLPIVTVLFFFVFVFGAQLYVSSQMKQRQKGLAEVLRMCEHKQLWQHVMQSVKQFFSERTAFMQPFVDHGVDSDLQASEQLLNDLNNILPLSCALNEQFSAQLSEAWRVECDDMHVTTCKLKRFDTRDWKWLLFEAPLHDWIHALRRLYRQRNDDAHTLITTYQLCHAASAKKLKGGMEWHGYVDHNGVNMLRPVRLQSDLLLIWTSLIALTQPFCAATRAHARSELCAPLRAHLGGVMDGALLLATAFHDCGARFIDGAHHMWRHAAHASACKRRDCASCAAAAPGSPASGVSELGHA